MATYSKRLQKFCKASVGAQTEDLRARIAALGTEMHSAFAEGLQRIQHMKQAAITNHSGPAGQDSSVAIGPEHPVMQASWPSVPLWPRYMIKAKAYLRSANLSQTP